jgi:hypothetical protein
MKATLLAQNFFLVLWILIQFDIDIGLIKVLPHVPRIQLSGKMYEGTAGDMVGIRPGNKGIRLVRPYKGRTVEFCLCVVHKPVRWMCSSSV